MTMNLMSLKRTTSTTWEASSWKILTKVRKIPRTTTSMTKNTYNILVLDGGGLRGLVTSVILDERSVPPRRRAT